MAHKTFGSFGVLMAIALLLVTNTRGDPVVGFGETAINGNPTGVGFVDVQITPPTSSGVGYLNVAVDWNNNGLDSGDWLVFNSEIPLQSTEFGGNSATFSSTFDLSSISLSAGSYTVYASFDPSARSPSDFTSLQTNLGVSFSLYDIGDLQDGINAGKDAGAGGNGAGSGFSLNPGNGSLSPLAQIVGRVRYDTPGIKQKKNECAPTSAAQSLYWLQKRHPGALGGKLPGQNDLIGQLKTAMQWDDGIDPGDFKPGKEKVIKDLKLDGVIVTKTGGQFDGTNTFDFVKKEIEAGEDVELRIQYKKADGSNDGGHWITAVGWFDDGTKKKLFFKDPLTGGDTIDEYELDGTRIKNYKYGARAYISFAVSQSVIPEPGTMVLFGIGVLAPAISALRRARKHQ
ncbi:MAG: PEP-CTERM sorting domain-containing protein [Chthonomonadetes bacterium]|nr:PEP-CTERM sorting domain-containing protein [Chthonomonadetes bacterium]